MSKVVGIGPVLAAIALAAVPVQASAASQGHVYQAAPKGWSCTVQANTLDGVFVTNLELVNGDKTLITPFIVDTGDNGVMDIPDRVARYLGMDLTLPGFTFSGNGAYKGAYANVDVALCGTLFYPSPSVVVMGDWWNTLPMVTNAKDTSLIGTGFLMAVGLTATFDPYAGTVTFAAEKIAS